MAWVPLYVPVQGPEAPTRRHLTDQLCSRGDQRSGPGWPSRHQQQRMLSTAQYTTLQHAEHAGI